MPTTNIREYVRARHLWRYYGITIEEWNALFAAQGFRCACCGEGSGETKWAVDHSHSTGKVRGILCQHCNVGIGQFRDSREILSAAIDYLSRESPACPVGLGVRPKMLGLGSNGKPTKEYSEYLAENRRQRAEKRGPYRKISKTHCPHGHLYDEANTGHSQGQRYCLRCKKESTERWREKKRGGAG